MTARSGAYCGPVGATDTTAKGTLMECKDRSPDRARWGATGGSGRRGLLRRARALGITVKRGTPDADIQALIAAPSAEAAPAEPEPIVVPPVTAAPFTPAWYVQRTAQFEHRHPAPGGGSWRTEPPTWDEIRRAHAAAVSANGGDTGEWGGATASVAAVRRHLAGGYRQADVDEALRTLGRQDGVTLYAEANQKVLLDVERAGAVEIGNQDKHLIKIRHQS